MKRCLRLSQLHQEQPAVVTEVLLRGAIRRRVFDLGFIPGTCVKRLQTGPAGSPIAYAVRGTVIALRRKDAEGITVEADTQWV